MKWILTLALAFATAFFANAASAQEVSECDWRASARTLVEPWEENSRAFANGNVRIALLDTIEPGAVPYQILVLSPPFDELGARQCRVISFQGGFGFAGVSFSALEASYDPAVGLNFSLPVVIYLEEANFANPSLLHFTVNQATGAVVADMELGRE